MKQIKILFIAMSNSIHTARWIKQIIDQKWQLYLFPSISTNDIHTDILDYNIKVFTPFLSKSRKNIILKILVRIIKKINNLYLNILKKKQSDIYIENLYKYLQKIKPDIIHTLETQYAGYLLYSVKEKYFYKKDFPKWWHTVWGSDIYLFGKMKGHKTRIQNVLSSCDFFSSDCIRDNKLAQDFGFNKEIMPLFNLGFQLDYLQKIKINNAKTSKRKIIFVKGYEGWTGRALVALYALKIIKDYLINFDILIHSYSDDSVKISAELLENEANINIKFIPLCTSHSDILRIHGASRIHIGLNISDGIPSSVLEAMAMGAFPIQSWTSAADEWIKDGESGFLVPPEDPNKVADAILRALTYDILVDNAAEINWKTVEKRLNFNDLQKKVINSYQKILIT